ncbi:MAG: DUF4384 domain-containing protein [Gammaproteobacteria bacterium]|nr:DUF4384 domain-containing protein [Gammaproteobacteria bacterium]
MADKTPSISKIEQKPGGVLVLKISQSTNRAMTVFIFSAVIFLNGCAATKFSPVKVTQLEKTKLQTITQSHPIRPVWLDSPPKDDDSFHYLVGLSNPYFTEKDARKDALRDARVNYARYTGVNVKEVSNMFASLYSKSSNIFDPSVVSLSENTESLNVNIHRVKAKQWYWQKEVSKKGAGSAYSYKYWVLVEVPHDEYVRVQEWKEKQNKVADENKIKKELALNGFLKSALDSHNKKMRRVEISINDIDPLKALILANSDWVNLYSKLENIESEQYKELSNLSKVKIDLSQAQAEALNAIARIRDSIVLDSGRPTNHILVNETQTIPAWVWMKLDGKYLPISNFPLTIINDENAVVATAYTNKDGEAKFELNQVSTGELKIGVNTSDGVSHKFDDKLKGILSKISIISRVKVAEDNLRGKISGLVNQLFYEPMYNTKKTTVIQLNDIEGDSVFDNSVMAHVEYLLSGMGGIVVLRERGVSSESIGLTTDSVKVLNIHIGETNGVSNNDVEISMNLSIKGDVEQQLVKSVSGWLPKRILETIAYQERGIKNTSIHEELLNTRQSDSEENNKIDISITSKYGDKQTYIEGDIISYFVSLSRDAFMLMIYEDAKGDLIQIIPNINSGSNFHKAQEYFEVPPTESNYQFSVTAPFGEETIYVYSSEDPFPQLTGEFKSNGLFYLDRGYTKEIIKRYSKYVKINKLAFGEAKTTIKTMPRMYTMN